MPAEHPDGQADVRSVRPRDVQAILDRVTDDVDWSTDAAIESAPWYGPKHGKDELVSFFEGIATTGPVTEFTPLAFAGNDDGDVLVFLRYAFTVTATGKHVAMNFTITGSSATARPASSAAPKTPRRSPPP